jgi:hypothetical protein
MAGSMSLTSNRSLSPKGSGRAADALTPDESVGCVVCGGRLGFLPYAYPFTFGCDRGHFMTLQSLLDVFLPQSQTQTPDAYALECWERKSQLMRHLARRALEVGHVLTAADFQEVAVRIDHWVTALRTRKPHNGSEALLSA